MTKIQPDIRAMEPTDWDAICRVHDLGRAQELAQGGVDPRAFQSLAANRKKVMSSPGIVACTADKVIGFATWWTDGYLSLLYVDPSMQGSGIGRALLNEALSEIGADAWTNAIEGNTPALALYLSVGMEIVHSRAREDRGYPYQSVRLALPTSWMRDPNVVRFPGAQS